MSDKHHQVGVCILLFMFSQPVFAWFRPRVETTYRDAWEVMHKGVGLVIVFGGILNIRWGLIRFDNYDVDTLKYSEWPLYFLAAISGWYIFSKAFDIYQERHRHLNKFSFWDAGDPDMDE